MQEKCPVMLTCRFGVVIVDDEFTWGHVRQTVLLQGKVPGDCCTLKKAALPKRRYVKNIYTASVLQFSILQMTNYTAQDFYL